MNAAQLIEFLATLPPDTPVKKLVPSPRSIELEDVTVDTLTLDDNLMLII